MGCAGRTAEGEVGLLVEIVAECDVIAGDTVFRTIIEGDVTMSLDRHGSRDRMDGLVTVSHLECHIGEISIGILELRYVQSHVRRTGVGTGSLCRAAESEVSHFVERVADAHVVAAHGVRRAVIVNGITMAGDGHHHVGHRSDCLVAIGHGECHGIEVRAVVGKLFFSQSHLGRTLVGALGLSRAAEGEVALLIEFITERDVIASDAMLMTVERRRIVMTSDGHGGSDRADGLIAVGDDERHGAEIRVRTRELRFVQSHVRRTSVGTGSLCRAAEGEVRCRIERVTDLHVVAGDGVRLAIVVSGIAVTGNLHNHAIARGDLLEAVGDVERHGTEVRGTVVRKLICLQAHGCHTYLCTLGLRRAAEGEVCFRIKRSGNLDVVAAHSVLLAVIHRVVVVASDGHDGSDG